MINKILNNKKAFTFMETIIVIVIIGITVAIWGFHGRDHVKIAMLSEGKMFIDRVVAQEKSYYSSNGTYFVVNSFKNEVKELFINTNGNKYYKKFKVTKSSSNLKIELQAEGTDMDDYKIVGTYTPSKDLITYDEVYE